MYVKVAMGAASIQERYASALPVYNRDLSKGAQVFEVTPSGQQDVDAVGRPLCHMAADKQTTGEALYIDDMPRFESELEKLS